jgi:hypothetical protein
MKVAVNRAEKWKVMVKVGGKFEVSKNGKR